VTGESYTGCLINLDRDQEICLASAEPTLQQLEAFILDELGPIEC